MFRFLKYDETGYTDFENSIFSNLNQSQFDRLNDILTIEDIEYRISSIKELCENCNNSETFINETMTTRPVNRTITTAGAKGTIPATNDHTDSSWLPTDLYNGEVLINTTDNVAYIRSGNEIRSWQLNPIDVNPPVAFEFIDPESLTVGNPPVEVMFYGSGLDRITGINYHALDWGVTVSGFEVLGQEQILLIIDASEADIEGALGVTLEIPFIIASDDNVIKASLSLLANSIPQGDPVITSIEPYGTDFFVSGEQTVIISGNDLNSRDNLSINPENDMITQLSHEFDENGNILAQMDIPEEVLNTHAEFVLSYDGYMSEPFQVYLSKDEIPQPSVPEITSIVPESGNGYIPGEQQIRISGNNLNRMPIELAEIQSSHHLITINGFDVNEDYFLVDVNIGGELIGMEVNFILTYQDGIMTEWFSVVLNDPTPQPKITSITDTELNPVNFETTEIIIKGNNFGEQGSIMIYAAYYENEVNHGSITRTDTEIVISGCEFAPYQGSVIEFYVSSNGNTSEAFSISI